jgi:hypothetical protein
MLAALAAEVTESVGVDRDQPGQQVRVGSRSGPASCTSAPPSRLPGGGWARAVSRTDAPESLVLSGYVRGLRVRGVEAPADGHRWAMYRS